MISYFVRVLLVGLILSFQIFQSTLMAQEGTASLTPNELNLLSGEIAESLTNLTQDDFERIFEYLPSQLSLEQKERAFAIYLHAQEEIAKGNIQDPRVSEKNFNSNFEGKLTTRIEYQEGEFGVSWIDGQPLVVISLDKERERMVFIPKGFNTHNAHFKRLVYYLHIFAGNNGHGIWDMLSDKSLGEKMLREHKKLFVRGADLSLITVDQNHHLIDVKKSKKPRWMGLKWWREYWGALFKGRKLTKSKFLTALGLASISSAMTYSFVDLHMAMVSFSFVLITQMYYEAYITYKFSNSFVMQIFKLAIVTAMTNATYALLSPTPPSLQTVFFNAGLSVYVFHSARLNKQLLIESNITTGDKKISLAKLAGKKVTVLGEEISLPNSLKKIAIKFNRAKLHDTTTDFVPGIIRQLQLAFEFSPLVMIGAAVLEHAYAYTVYKVFKMNKLDNLAIDRIMGEVFYRNFFSSMLKSVKNQCNKLFSPGGFKPPLRF